MSEYNCPKCGSPNTKSLSAIWSSGNRSSKTNAGGISISSKGTVRVAKGGANTVHTSSKISDAAPPQYNGGTSPLVMSIVVYLLVLVVLTGFLTTSDDGGFISSIFGLLFIGVPLVAAIYTYKYVNQARNTKKQEYIKQFEQYEHTWLCQRCNTKYVVR